MKDHGVSLIGELKKKLIEKKQAWAKEGRLLTGRSGAAGAERLPPGQRETRDWPVLDPRNEVVIACDFASEERRAKLGSLAEASLVVQSSAIAGAVHWALHRNLAVRQIHGGGRGFFVPVYLTSRDDLTVAPELVAPIQVQSNRLVVRTLLDPHVAYSPARAVVERWEQIQSWLLDAWDQATEGNAAGEGPARAAADVAEDEPEDEPEESEIEEDEE